MSIPSTRKVMDINKDKKGKYEEIKIGGTIESSDEDEEDENPFIQNGNKDQISKGIKTASH